MEEFLSVLNGLTAGIKEGMQMRQQRAAQAKEEQRKSQEMALRHLERTDATEARTEATKEATQYRMNMLGGTLGMKRDELNLREREMQLKHGKDFNPQYSDLAHFESVAEKQMKDIQETASTLENLRIAVKDDPEQAQLLGGKIKSLEEILKTRQEGFDKTQETKSKIEDFLSGRPKAETTNTPKYAPKGGTKKAAIEPPAKPSGPDPMVVIKSVQKAKADGLNAEQAGQLLLDAERKGYKIDESSPIYQAWKHEFIDNPGKK